MNHLKEHMESNGIQILNYKKEMSILYSIRPTSKYSFVSLNDNCTYIKEYSYNFIVNKCLYAYGEIFIQMQIKFTFEEI